MKIILILKIFNEWTAFQLICAFKFVEVLNYLDKITYFTEEDINIKDDDGRNRFHYICKNNFTKKNINIKDNCCQTSFHYICKTKYLISLIQLTGII